MHSWRFSSVHASAADHDSPRRAADCPVMRYQDAKPNGPLVNKTAGWRYPSYITVKLQLFPDVIKPSLSTVPSTA